MNNSFTNTFQFYPSQIALHSKGTTLQLCKTQVLFWSGQQSHLNPISVVWFEITSPKVPYPFPNSSAKHRSAKHRHFGRTYGDSTQVKVVDIYWVVGGYQRNDPDPMFDQKHQTWDSWDDAHVQERYNRLRYRTPRAIPLANSERNLFMACW